MYIIDIYIYIYVQYKEDYLIVEFKNILKAI